MARTPSTMIPLGTPAPEFSLPDVVTGGELTLSVLKSEVATVIMFICNHCPYVRHIHSQLVQLPKEYQSKGVKFAAISSNDADQYPDDSPEKMKEEALRLGYTFPYLYDESQSVAQAYSAACTPDFYVFDKDLLCVYRGQLDDSRRGSELPVTGHDLRQALDALLEGRSVSEVQTPSLGCNIKWKN